MICNAELYPNYFSVNVFVLAGFSVLIVGFLKIVREMQQLVRKLSQKINFEVILDYISLPIFPLHFPKFCPIQK